MEPEILIRSNTLLVFNFIITYLQLAGLSCPVHFQNILCHFKAPKNTASQKPYCWPLIKTTSSLKCSSSLLKKFCSLPAPIYFVSVTSTIDVRNFCNILNVLPVETDFTRTMAWSALTVTNLLSNLQPDHRGTISMSAQHWALSSNVPEYLCHTCWQLTNSRRQIVTERREC